MVGLVNQHFQPAYNLVEILGWVAAADRLRGVDEKPVNTQ